jgi:hypothetical protein
VNFLSSWSGDDEFCKTTTAKKAGRGGARPSQPLFNPEKGGELMEIYTLEVELLEEIIAPIGSSVGGG